MENITIQTLFSFNGSQICFLIRLNHSHDLRQVAAQPNQRTDSNGNFPSHGYTLAVISALAAWARDSSWAITYVIQEQENSELYAHWKSNSVFLACAVALCLVGLPKLTLEIKFPLCCVLLHSVSLSPLFPIEFCSLIAICSGKYVLTEALEKPAQWRPIDSPPGTCLSMNNISFASMKEKLGYHGTSQHPPPPATTITSKR